jgi:hypothetical protein
LIVSEGRSYKKRLMLTIIIWIEYMTMIYDVLKTFMGLKRSSPGTKKKPRPTHPQDA